MLKKLRRTQDGVVAGKTFDGPVQNIEVRSSGVLVDAREPLQSGEGERCACELEAENAVDVQIRVRVARDEGDEQALCGLGRGLPTKFISANPEADSSRSRNKLESLAA